MTSLQTTQAYQVTYDYGKEGALVDALLGGDVPERRTPRKTNQAQVAALPDDDDDGSFGESDDDEAERQLQTIQQKVFSPEQIVEPVPEPSPVPLDVPDELRQKRQAFVVVPGRKIESGDDDGNGSQQGSSDGGPDCGSSAPETG